jgi:hypothetical protein
MSFSEPKPEQRATKMMESKPVATVAQFRQALLTLRNRDLPESHVAMLRAQCRALACTMTATELAKAAGYKNYNAANLQYGTLGFNLAGILGFSPTVFHADGSHCWWATLSYSTMDQKKGNAEQFQFIMRPELADALREMRWA